MLMNVNITPNCVSPASMKAAYNGCTVAYCILLVVSLAGNSFVGIIVYKTKTMRKTINFFIVNMAMSDLLFSVFAFPWALTELNAGSWLISGIFGHTLCKMISFAKVVSLAVSIQSLVLIAVDRFAAVVFPLRSPLRWPNTVFARAFADAIQRVHKDCKNKHVVNRAIILFIQNPHYMRYFSLLLNAVY